MKDTVTSSSDPVGDAGPPDDAGPYPVAVLAGRVLVIDPSRLHPRASAAEHHAHLRGPRGELAPA